jgi:predicted transcriptional regulator of viral defense system
MKQRASETELSALIAIAAKKGTVTLASFKKEQPEIRSPAEVLRRLTEKGLVIRKTRGQYTIDDELFCEYLRRMRDD